MILHKKQSGLTTERSFINYNRGFLMTFNIICEPNGIFMGFDNLGGRVGSVWCGIIKMWRENTQKYPPFNFNKCYILRLNNLQMTLFAFPWQVAARDTFQFRNIALLASQKTFKTIPNTEQLILNVSWLLKNMALFLLLNFFLPVWLVSVSHKEKALLD